MTRGGPGHGSVAAVDLGASGGRVVVGAVGPGTLTVTEVHRFPNGPVRLPDGLHWDVNELRREVLAGLRLAARREPAIRSIGIDGWGVDYGLLDSGGRLLGTPYHYRDDRAARGVEIVHARIPPEALYAATGIQFLAFNTIYQLAAAIGTPELDDAATFLMVPDLLGFWLTGARIAETTNASTTGLLDLDGSAWRTDLAAQVGIPASIFPPLRRPGTTGGEIGESIREATGIPPGTPLTLVGSHDTASAVVAVPAETQDVAYISCGTWGLVGVELAAPLVKEAGRLANFTNERGVDDRIRYLRNVTGLWLLQECVRTWERNGDPVDLASLVEAAAALPRDGPVVDPDGPSFRAPGDMPRRIAEACRREDGRAPRSRPAIVRCILDSLAIAFARSVDDATRLSGRTVDVVHLVGGGSRIALLCQLTADACGRPVVAGPVEATAIGNVLIQARARGLVEGDLATLRTLVRATQPLRTYRPADGTPGAAAPFRPSRRAAPARARR